jgi:hypothetical protein
MDLSCDGEVTGPDSVRAGRLSRANIASAEKSFRLRSAPAESAGLQTCDDEIVGAEHHRHYPVITFGNRYTDVSATPSAVERRLTGEFCGRGLVNVRGARL